MAKKIYTTLEERVKRLEECLNDPKEGMSVRITRIETILESHKVWFSVIIGAVVVNIVVVLVRGG